MSQMLTPLIFPNKPRNLTIGDELNRGAWGVVYNGDLEGRPVAVKRIHELLHQEGGEEEGRKLFENFREECKKLQSLSHPHVVGKRNVNIASFKAARIDYQLASGIKLCGI